MPAFLLNPWVILGLVGTLLIGGGGLYLKGRHDGKAAVLHALEVKAFKLKAEQDTGIADVLTTFIFGEQDDAKLTPLLDSAVDGLCPVSNSPGVPPAARSAADQARAAKVAAAVKSDLKSGVACHRQLSSLIDAAIVAGAAKP